MPEQDIQQQVEPRHSGLGIASFVTSIAAAVLMIAAIAVAGVIEVSTPGGVDDNSLVAILVGLAIMGLLTAELIAFGLGIGALFQKERRKVLAILGLVFSAAFVAMGAGLIAIGLAVG